MKPFQDLLDKVLDTFFHLPTFIFMALIGLIFVWQVYGARLNIGNGFIRLDSNLGNATLYWQNGCCQLDW